jgi:nicotinamidase-related amidase
MRKVLISVPFILVILIGLFTFNFIRYKKYAYRISMGNEIKADISDKPALLIFNIQEGTTGDLSDIEYYKSSSPLLIAKINRLADSTNQHNVLVIYVRNEVTNFVINLLNKKLAAETPGVDLDKRLKKVPGYMILNDKMDAFNNSGLDSILVKHGINRLYFTGLDPTYSIGNTYVAAGNRNYRVSMIQDAIISKSAVLKNRKLLEFNRKGCEVISSEAYFKRLADIE